MGLMSSNYLEQQAALHALSTLMSTIPNETYIQFEKVSLYVVHTKCLDYLSLVLLLFGSCF